MNALAIFTDHRAHEQRAKTGACGSSAPCPGGEGDENASADPRVSAKSARRVIAARAARRRFLPIELFADPAWDILLELYALECEQRRTSVSKLCIAAAVPATTALRWIDKLHAEQLIIRSADPLDARRVWVSLSKAGWSAMKRYFDDLEGSLSTLISAWDERRFRNGTS